MHPGSGGIIAQYTNADVHGRSAGFSNIDADADADANTDAHAHADANSHADGDTGYRYVYRYRHDATGYTYDRANRVAFTDTFWTCQWCYDHGGFFCRGTADYRLPV